MKAHLIMTTLALVAVATNSAYAAPGVQVGAKAQTPGIQGNIDQTAPLLNGARGISTPSESGAQQSTKVLSLGDRASGGGNTVGDQLFDDYENSGSVVILASEIADLVAPTLNDLEQKTPGFATKLREGIKGIIWYKEPKPLSQDGLCRNGADTGLTPAIGQVVRACQNNLDVRIEQNFYEKNKTEKPELLAGLIVHELIVYQRIHSTRLNISEEAVYMISRDVRSKSVGEQQLVNDLKTAGFGTYQTGTVSRAESEKRKYLTAELNNLNALSLRSLQLHCDFRKLSSQPAKKSEADVAWKKYSQAQSDMEKSPVYNAVYNDNAHDSLEPYISGAKILEIFSHGGENICPEFVVP